MKRTYFVCLFLCLTTTFLLAQSNPISLVNQTSRVIAPISASHADPKAQARILDQYGKLSLAFEANHGQTDAQVKFLSRTGGYTLFLTGDEAVLALSGTKTNEAKIAGTTHKSQSAMDAPKVGVVLRMKLRHANPGAKVTGLDEMAGTSNYFIGNDPAKWRSNVPTYAKVKYEGIYSGIDLVYYGDQRQLEYDFIVAPGADPRRIAFDVRGAKWIRKDGKGDLVFNMGDDEIRWCKPVVYQKKNGARQEIAARYAIADTNRVAFEVAKYDASRPLYIDPLIYSTYLGGSGLDRGYGIAVDGLGNAYVAGLTESLDFPTTSGALKTTCGGPCGIAFVTKLNPAGSALVYSTYLGGSGGEYGYGIVVDGLGNAYVTGYTNSTDFPLMNALQPTYGGGGDAFVSKLNPEGSELVYSTYIGGSGFDGGQSIALDSAGNAYVTGYTTSADFPVTPGAFQTVCNSGSYCGYHGDAFVSKLNPSGSALLYSTYLGGGQEDFARGIAVDSAGNTYVTGFTYSTDFPISPGAFQMVCKGCSEANFIADAFVSKLNPAGSALIYSTFLGGSRSNEGEGIAVDSAGNAYITGATGSTDFPTTPGAFQTVCRSRNCGKASNAGNAFVTKFDPSGSVLVYSTYLGGNGGDRGDGIAVDNSGNAYVAGTTNSTTFPLVNPLQKRAGGYSDTFVAQLNAAGSALAYSTYLGGGGDEYCQGVALDSAGIAYVTGYTFSTNFPTMNPWQATNAGNSDAFVTKLHISALTATTLSSSLNPSTYGQAVTLTAVITSSLGAPPDGETVTFVKGTTVLGTGALSGGLASLMTSTLKVGANSITAVYGGDSNFVGSKSKTVSQVVSKATTTTALVSSVNPSNSGQSVTFAASVLPQFGGTVTGSVTFYDGTTLLKTLALSGGKAKFTTSALASGAHSITATYNGSTSFTGSSASLTQTVN